MSASEIKLAGTRETQPYAALAAKLRLSEGAVRVAVHWLRLRYRKLFQEEIAHTVSSPPEIKEELNYLFQVMGTDNSFGRC